MSFKENVFKMYVKAFHCLFYSFRGNRTTPVFSFLYGKFPRVPIPRITFLRIEK
jgi:hypothetical protein